MADQRLLQYVGREQRVRDIVARRRIEELAALFDFETDELLGDDGRIPPLTHWLFFNHWPPRYELGTDGHPKRGDFMPPIALPRRMFAGGRLQFLQPVRLGDDLERITTIQSILEKTGASGPLVFVTLQDEIRTEGGTAILEERDYVYRAATEQRSAESKQGAKPAEDVPANAWRQKIDPDPVYLFRFSALTFNSHRIHYDRRYTMEEENYPGLIVHGPLQAMLLTLLVRRNLPHAEIKEFAFRSRRAIFDGAPFSCVGWRSEQDPRQVELSTRDADGNVCMSANATLR